MPPKSNKDIGYESEIRLLIGLSIFGHLRRDELLRYVWPDKDSNEVGSTFYRVVDRLIKKRLIIQYSNNIGGSDYALRKKGADLLLHQCYLEVDANVNSRHPMSELYYHRTLTTRYLIERINADQDRRTAVSSEYGLNNKLGPVYRNDLIERFKKSPDGLVISPSDQNPQKFHVDFVETESADKPTKRLDKILGITSSSGWRINTNTLDQYPEYVLNNLYVIYDSKSAHEKRILSAAKRYLRQSTTYQDKLPTTLFFVRCHVKRPLIWEGYEEIPCSSLL